MAIAILAAMPVEFKLIWQNMENCQEQICAGFRFWHGSLRGKRVILGECGIGKVNAALATQILIERFLPTAILHSGVAGGLGNEIRHMDFVVAEDLSYYDVRRRQMEQLFPYCGQFKTDERLTKLIEKTAKQTGQRVWKGRIVSGDSFVQDSTQRQAIQQEWNALCMDMESAAIAHTAYINNIPLGVVRCISDLADDSSTEDYDRFEKAAAEKSAELIINVIAKMPQ